MKFLNKKIKYQDGGKIKKNVNRLPLNFFLDNPYIQDDEEFNYAKVPYRRQPPFVQLTDDRKIRATTGKPINPNRDLRTQKLYNVQRISDLVGYAKLHSQDLPKDKQKEFIYDILGTSLLESNLTKDNYENPMHVRETIHGKNSSRYNDLAEYGVLYKKKAGENYVGKGKLGPSTEIFMNNGKKNTAFFGVPLNGKSITAKDYYSKELDDMKKILKSPKNPWVNDIIDTTSVKNSSYIRPPVFPDRFREPRFGTGGFIKKTGNFFQNLGVGIADNTLSVFGADQVLDNSYTKDSMGKSFKKYTDVQGKINQAAAPIVASAMLGPGAGTAVSQVQSIGKSFNPQTTNQGDIEKVGDMSNNILNMYNMFNKTSSIPTFGLGGPVNNPDTIINTEKDELLVDSDGKILKKYRGFPLHPDNPNEIDPRGNTSEKSGNIVIPRKLSKLYEEGDSIRRMSIISNLKKEQIEKSKEELLNMQKNKTKIFSNFKKVQYPFVQNMMNDIYGLQATDFYEPEGFRFNTYHDGGDVLEPRDYSSVNNNPYFSFRKRFNPKGLDYSTPKSFTDINTPTSYSFPVKTGFDINSVSDKNFDLTLKNNTYFDNENNVLNTENNTQSEPWYNTAGEFLANSVGPIYGLMKYRKPERVSYGQLSPDLVDPTSALMDAEIQNRLLNENIRSASGGNSGNYLSNRIASGTSNAMNKFRIRKEYDNTNSSIKNQFKQFNKELNIREQDVNAQNKAMLDSMRVQWLSELGKNAAESYKGRRYSERNDLLRQYLEETFPQLKRKKINK